MRRSSRRNGRRRTVTQGRRNVLLTLAFAIAFYLGFLALTILGGRFGALSRSGEFTVAVAIVGSICLLAIGLAVAAYRTHRAPRYIYLLLNIVGGAVGIVWAGVQLALRQPTVWVALDLAGVASALIVCWTFFYSKNARKFLQEKELTVKRT